RERARSPFTTSARLVELVRDAVPAPARRTGGNPAKRTFQALRIEVNGELEVLARAVPRAVAALPVELPEHAPYLRLLTRGAEQPAADETAANPRAASARLRAAERVRAGR